MIILFSRDECLRIVELLYCSGATIKRVMSVLQQVMILPQAAHTLQGQKVNIVYRDEESRRRHQHGYQCYISKLI